MKKQKKRKAVPKRVAVSMPAAVAVSEEAPSKRGVFWTKTKAVVTGAGAILALGLSIMHYWPEISIEPSAAAEASNPFSGYYKITNEQAYPLTNVGVEVSLRCWKMGLGSDTSPLKSCLPSMHTSKTLWKGHTLEPREPYEITPGDLMFVTPGALLYAQIDLFVSYYPWILPIPMTKELRFQSRRLSDGRFEWLHVPAD
jgi:hypothetical protein